MEVNKMHTHTNTNNNNKKVNANKNISLASTTNHTYITYREKWVRLD